MIARHRITGEELLNVSQMRTSHVDGWDDARSEALFEEIAMMSDVRPDPVRFAETRWHEGEAASGQGEQFPQSKTKNINNRLSN